MLHMLHNYHQSDQPGMIVNKHDGTIEDNQVIFDYLSRFKLVSSRIQDKFSVKDTFSNKIYEDILMEGGGKHLVTREYALNDDTPPEKVTTNWGYMQEDANKWVKFYFEGKHTIIKKNSNLYKDEFNGSVESYNIDYDS